MKNGNGGGSSLARGSPASPTAAAAATSLALPLSGSPRSLQPHARPLALSLASPRLVDPDGFHRDTFDDRDIFGRYVADHRTAAARPTVRGNYSVGGTSTGSTAAVPVLTFSRTLAQSSAYYDAEKSPASPRPAAPVQPASPVGKSYSLSPSRGSRQSPSKMRPLHVLRPHSPVSDSPPETVVSLPMMQQLSPRGAPRQALLSAPDAEKITVWLQSLKRESRQFSSYFLYCETLFRESDTLLRGKPTPNRLQTAVAFHCLCEATGLFARHEHVLHRICRDLGAAVFVAQAEAPLATAGDAMDALEYYANQLTYYDQQRVLQQQRDDMQRDLQVQTSRNAARPKEEQLNLAKIKDLESRYKIKALESITQRNTANEELGEKLQAVLQGFQYMDEDEKQKVVLGVVEALRAHITADTLVAITDQISHYEKDKLLRELFQGDIAQLTEKIRSEVVATSSAQQNAILERSAARITRFQTLIWSKLRSGSASVEGGGGDADSPAFSPHDDDDLCDQDRKVLESITDVMDELQHAKRCSAALEQQLRDAEQAINSLRWKSNQQLNEAQDAALQHAREIAELKEEFAKAIVQTDDKGVQTDKSRGGQRGDGGGGGGDDDDDDDGSVGGSTSGGNGGRGRRRRGANGEEVDDGLLVKNRRVNQFGFGIASIIEQAKIPASKIRKILAKRKPLTLSELHSIIVGYYQAKMYQDDQDDTVGKPRSNLAQFIMDMYTLHYGLKDLAISQLVFLDASIRKHAGDSARVHTFGLLTGSLEPDSHACSVQGVDFFLFVVVVMFNAGIYKRGRKQAAHVAQNLKTFFGEGRSVALRSDVICTSIDLIFSFTRNETGGVLDRLKDEVRVLSVNAVSGGGLEVDVALEKIMNHWFMLYEQQIVDIHAMFALVDANGDGTLDFREFCEVVQVLEPDMDRREALAIYNKAAGDDHVIDKDEFVQVMLAHQRGAILKEFYSGDSAKKSLAGIQQRKATFGSTFAAQQQQPSAAAVPGSGSSSGSAHHGLQYKTLAGGVAHLDREESYASLVAAMSVVTDAIQPLDTAEEDQDDDGDIASGQDAAQVQDSVSFMTLSRLSVWASEAKGKLLGSSATPPASASSGVRPLSQPGSRLSSPGLGRIPEQSQHSFERDVNELLEQALSKANIDINDVF